MVSSIVKSFYSWTRLSTDGEVALCAEQVRALAWLEDRGGGQPGAAEGVGEEGGEGLRDDGEGVGEVILVQTGHDLSGVCNCNYQVNRVLRVDLRGNINITL